MPTKVIGIGDNVVDKYLHSGFMYPGGNALNFSAYAKILGANAAYIGVFANDYAGKYVSSVMSTLDVDISHCRYLEGENGYACIDLVDGERVFLYSNKGGISKDAPLELSQDDLDYIRSFSLIHSSINSHIYGGLKSLKDLNIPISYDFSNKGTEDYFVKLCPYVDYAIISCGQLNLEDTHRLISFIHSCGSNYVIATRGSEGAIFSDGLQIYNHKADLIEAKDTLGAGDSFLTAFLLSFIEWKNKLLSTPTQEQKNVAVEKAMSQGSKFAAETCMIDGAFGYGTPIIS